MIVWIASRLTNALHLDERGASLRPANRTRDGGVGSAFFGDKSAQNKHALPMGREHTGADSAHRHF
jgi:hypothetical protein